MTFDPYNELAHHLHALGMGYPLKDELLGILRANFSPAEAEAALAVPNTRIPLEVATADEVAARLGRPVAEVAGILEGLARRGLLFSGTTKDGQSGYALQQVGYGFPQSFFWKGERTPHAEDMAQRMVRYFRSPEIKQTYGATPTKAFRYIPIKQAIRGPFEAVYTYEMMEAVIGRARTIAVAHCPCRMTAQLLGKALCDHPLEVCMKYDELAEYLIERGMARPVDVDEALAITRFAEESGLVHMGDNSQEGIKHTCNCCQHACWNVGPIARRRLARDDIMATYFLRTTDEEICIGCGDCIEACPVDALVLGDEFPIVDEAVCLGCGLCAIPCPSDAARLKRRTDVAPPPTFTELHGRILEEKAMI
ncbi:MAG: 4Fe-4S dicluster-binding protein [Anaerolineae bacterium]